MDSVKIKHKVKYSKLYNWLSIKVGNELGKVYKQDRIFFGSLFEKRKIKKVFDIGANDGIRSKTFIELANYLVTVEPDPVLASIIRYRFGKNLAFRMEEVALGAERGEAELNKKIYSGYNTLSEKWSKQSDLNGINTIEKLVVDVLTIEDLILKHGLPDYAKIDVEGFEVNVIKGLKNKISVISFEANLPNFLEETVEIINMLKIRSGSCLFNYRDGNSEMLGLAENISDSEMIRMLKSFPQKTVDIFAFC